MTMAPTNLCSSCTLEIHGTGTCAAFPNGIPNDIFFRLADHRVSVAGEPTYSPDPARAVLFDAWDAARKVAP